MKYFAISDIHGCYKTLMALMKKLPINRSKDTVVFLGDYIDRGPRTMQVVDRLMKWNKRYPHWQFLFGNHESLMLDALIGGQQLYHSYDLWWKQGGKETFESYIPLGWTEYEKRIMQPKDVISWEHLDWLRQRPYYFDGEGYFFVHASAIPNMSLEDFKKGIEDGNVDFKKRAIWDRDIFIFSKYDWGKKIIFGHTADYDSRYHAPPGGDPFQPIIRKNKIGIDLAVCPPACNKLCAIELPSEKFYFQDYVD